MAERREQGAVLADAKATIRVIQELRAYWVFAKVTHQPASLVTRKVIVNNWLNRYPGLKRVGINSFKS